MNLTAKERKELRELVDILYALRVHEHTAPHGKKLHGGLFPLLGLLFTGLMTGLRFAVPAIARALPTIARGAVQLGSRALTAASRGVATTASRGAANLARISQAGLRSGATRGAITTGAKGATRGATTGARGLAGQTTARSGLVSKGFTALDFAAGNTIDPTTGEEMGYNDLPLDAGDNYDARDLPPPPPPQKPITESDLPPDTGDGGGDEEAEDQSATLAPLRFRNRVRNVFTASASRNPLSSAYQTSAYSTTPATASTRVRDIGVFRGSGITHKKRVLKKYGLADTGHSVADLARVSGVPESTLQEVYNRGIGAYKTNPRSVRMKVSFAKNVDAPMKQKLSKEQWAMARVYSFLNNNPKHDTDLRGGMEHEEEGKCVNSPCGVHTFTTLKENGFPALEIPEIASRLVKMEERGGLNDKVINDALEPYVAVNITAGKGEVFAEDKLQHLLAEMKQNQLSGVLFLTGDDHPDHIVPVVYRDGKLLFVDEGERKREIKTDKTLTSQKWWSSQSYDDVYKGVDRVILLTPQ